MNTSIDTTNTINNPTKTINNTPSPRGEGRGGVFASIQDEIIEEFCAMDDWMDRYQMLIDMGSEMAPLPAADKTEQNLIDGCQSRVWLVCDREADGTLTFRAESDALIVKGIVALLVRVLSGHTPQEIAGADLYFIDAIGLREHLSPTRSNGLLAMLRQMKLYATVLGNKE